MVSSGDDRATFVFGEGRSRASTTKRETFRVVPAP